MTLKILKNNQIIWKTLNNSHKYNKKLNENLSENKCIHALTQENIKFLKIKQKLIQNIRKSYAAYT